ncbi:hypothetical protein HMPREF1991_02347 [Hoylesella loescheii DSM 19665 = JCM 12249 = ATCC 15930]|uniref:Uncharacterized protein n=1 Tax=Hoylesella loescheii DSM 19665 = JCM 12249 = ATCC 15930 TaxID=1122985 RepID=A0A069QFQ6_HOYLO|nr:hypothetical protein HMPREF1991_02347 [Hoylesella loescheii DSM 19665 = JCM 12249 = ATCC 15930]
MGNYMGIRAIGFAGGSYALFEYGVFSRAGVSHWVHYIVSNLNA